MGFAGADGPACHPPIDLRSLSWSPLPDLLGVGVHAASGWLFWPDRRYRRRLGGAPEFWAWVGQGAGCWGLRWSGKVRVFSGLGREAPMGVGWLDFWGSCGGVYAAVMWSSPTLRGPAELRRDSCRRGRRLGWSDGISLPWLGLQGQVGGCRFFPGWWCPV